MINIARVLVAFSLTTLFLLASCSQPTRNELLIGNWQYDHLDIQSALNGRQLTPMDEMKLFKMEGMMKNMSLEFYEDKSYVMKIASSMRDFLTHGSYSLEGDGKYLTILTVEKNGAMKTERYEILELTKDVLTMKPEKGANIIYKKLTNK
jgi:hypothetical protein